MIIIYTFLMGIAFFQFIISLMYARQMKPTLLPVKLSALYLVLGIACIVFVYLKKRRAKESKEHRDFRYFIPGAVIFAVGFFCRQLYTKNQIYTLLAGVYAVKRQGVVVPDVAVMLGYYAEQLTGISASFFLTICFPLIVYMMAILLFYKMAELFYPKNFRKQGVLFAMSEIMLLFAGHEMVLLFFPLLMFRPVFEICVRVEKIELTKKQAAEGIFIILIALYLYPVSGITVILECVAGILYLLGRGYLKWVQSSKQ